MMGRIVMNSYRAQIVFLLTAVDHMGRSPMKHQFIGTQFYRRQKKLDRSIIDQHFSLLFSQI